MNVNNKRPSDIPLQELDQLETKKEKVELCPILKLPDEIILQIFLSTDTKARLPLVCKRFQAICQETSYLIFTKAFDRFLPQINQKLINIVVEFSLSNFDQFKEGLNWELFNMVFNSTVTDQEKTWIKYGSRYQEIDIIQFIQRKFNEVVLRTSFDLDENEEYVNTLHKRYLSTYRPKYMEIAGNIDTADIFLPITDSLQKIKKQITYLKVKESPQAYEPIDFLDHKTNTAFISSCTKLEHLELYDHNLSNDRNFDSIFQSSNIKKLTISFNEFEEEVIETKIFELMAKTTSLQEIVLILVELDKEKAEYLASMPSLKKLTIKDRRILDVDRTIAGSPFITELVLDVLNYTSWMYHLQFMPSLEKLTINHFESFEIKAVTPYPKLKHLVIKNPNADSSIDYLQNLVCFFSLETLEIHHKLTDVELSKLPLSIKTLRCLNGSHISELVLDMYNNLTVELI